MKLTCDEGPNDWRRHFKRPRVTLDGVEVDLVQELDTEAGYLIRLAKDGSGQFLVDGEEVKTERLVGRVDVKEAA